MDTEKLRECLIFFVLRHSRRVQRTKLVKLVYLSDLLSWQTRGQTITGVRYINYDHGPWSRVFYDALGHSPEICEKAGVTPFGDSCYTYSGNISEAHYEHLERQDIDVLEKIDAEWGNRSLKEILAYVYNTEPFRQSRFGDRIDFQKPTAHS